MRDGCRALDNQIFAVGVSPARDAAASYVAWGHSTAVSPWLDGKDAFTHDSCRGDVLVTCGHEPALLFADLDLSAVESVRQAIPVRAQRRPELYPTTVL